MGMVKNQSSSWFCGLVWNIRKISFLNTLLNALVKGNFQIDDCLYEYIST